MQGPLLTLCAGVGTLGDLHCAFSHTSLRGAAGILCLQKEKWAKRESEREKERERQKNSRGGVMGRMREIDGARVRNIEGERWRGGSKTGPEARQKSIRASGDIEETNNNSSDERMILSAIFLFFCLSAVPQSHHHISPKGRKGFIWGVLRVDPLWVCDSNGHRL